MQTYLTVNQVYEEVLCVLVDAKRQHAQDITIRLARQQGLISVLSADETFSRQVPGRLTKQQIDVLRIVGYPISSGKKQ